MAKNYYQTTKVVKVTEPNKVVIRSNSTVAGQKGDPGTQILSGPGQPSSLIGQVGDMWLNTTTKIIYGPKTNLGWPTTPLFEGFNTALLGQVYSIPTPATVWEIQHDLGYNPNATCIDTAGTVIEGDISYPNENLMVIQFIGNVSGKAYLS
jgi:hypothetical protein